MKVRVWGLNVAPVFDRQRVNDGSDVRCRVGPGAVTVFTRTCGQQLLPVLRFRERAGLACYAARDHD